GIVAQAKGYIPDRTVDDITVKPDRASIVDVPLEPHAQVLGKVLSAIDHHPLAAVEVSLLKIEADAIKQSAAGTTNKNGEFTISGLASGRYYVAVHIART